MEFDWKKTVAAVAPTIAAALGGPLAGTAVSAISRALFDDEDGTEADIAATLVQANPEVLLKLKEADNQFKLDMKRLDVDIERIHQADRVSARGREEALRDTTPRILAGLFVVGFFAVLGAYMHWTIPESATQPINIMLGALTAGLLKVLDYYFGSSSGSAAKNTMLLNAPSPIHQAPAVK